MVGDETNKKGYKGGLVLEPEVGMYDDYVVLVDFNSLYPSIIRNFNICFTTIQRNFLEYDGGFIKKKIENENELKEENEQEETTNINDLENEEVDYLGRIKNTRIEKVGEEYKEIRNTETPILVRIVALLIEKRKQVKNILKDKGLSNAQKKKYDIMQTAYKLTANSIYGCLGFPSSRFYSRMIADTVTGLGRQLLIKTKEMVEEKGYKVIYGDTDSIMINTESKTIQEAIREATQIKEIINKNFRKKKAAGAEEDLEDTKASDKYNQKYNQNAIIEEEVSNKTKTKIVKKNEGILQVGIDGVYKKLLLIKKKKYAGLLVKNWLEISQRKENEEKTKLEIKGLEIVRRDCPNICKEISQKAIELILYKENYLELLEDHLLSYKNALDLFDSQFNQKADEKLNDSRKIAIVYKLPSKNTDALLQSNGNSQSILPKSEIRINLNSFVIKKMLNKSLRQYSDLNNHPHAIVAKYLIEEENKTEEELIGRFIPFVISQSDNNNDSIGKKAKHLSQLKKKNLNIDIEWYKVNQIKAVLSRSIGVVHNIDDDFLNKMLGLKSDIKYDNEDESGNYEINSLMYKIGSLPNYYRKMIKKFGLDNSKLNEIFAAICPNDKCLGCSFFLNQCPKGSDPFTKEELKLRAEMTLFNLKKVYSKCLKFGTSSSSLHELNPIVPSNIPLNISEKYKGLDAYYQKIHVCFYVYFLLYKLGLISVSKTIEGAAINEKKMGVVDLLQYENELRNGSFEYLLNSVNSNLNQFRTNQLSKLIDISLIV